MLEVLAGRARAGDAASFSMLVARLQRPLFRFLLVRIGSAADAEELAQEAFLAAWEGLSRYDPTRPFRPWLYTIARRTAIDRLRRATRHPTEPLDQEPESGELDPQAASEEAERRENLWLLAGRVLDDEQRSALWLRYVEDLTPEAIGEVLGRRAGSVRVLLFRARRRLAEHLPRPAGLPAHASLAAEGPDAALVTEPCPGGT